MLAAKLETGRASSLFFHVVFLCFCGCFNVVASRTTWHWNGNTTKLLNYNDKLEVSGSVIAITQAPWQVSVRLRALEVEYFGAGHICGGTLMTRRVVISAAHCVLNEDSKPLTYRTPSDYVLVMGSAYLYEVTQYTLEYDVIEIQVNIGFNYTTMANDIALFFIDGMVPSGWATASPVPLNYVALPSGTTCLVTGWGGILQNDYISSRLLGAYVPIVSNTVCASNHTGMLCAGYLGGFDGCQSDSAGPLVCNNRLAGIMSWGVNCTQVGIPGVYTNISHYMAWISWANSTFDYGSGIDVVYDYYNGKANQMGGRAKLTLLLMVTLVAASLAHE